MMGLHAFHILDIRAEQWCVGLVVAAPLCPTQGSPASPYALMPYRQGYISMKMAASTHYVLFMSAPHLKLMLVGYEWGFWGGECGMWLRGNVVRIRGGNGETSLCILFPSGQFKPDRQAVSARMARLI